MPKSLRTGWGHQSFLWRCANAHMLVVCRCRRCKILRTYLASDLIPVFGSSAVVGELWGHCPRCGASNEWAYSEQERYAFDSDIGNTVIRRINGYRKVRLWKDEYYGPPAYGPHRPFTEM